MGVTDPIKMIIDVKVEDIKYFGQCDVTGSDTDDVIGRNDVIESEDCDDFVMTSEEIENSDASDNNDVKIKNIFR